MLKNEIEVGETYLFVGSESPARRHLAGTAFTVTRKERVYRKMTYKRKNRTVKVLRFFNDDGIGARAEELEPLPNEDFYQCTNQDCRQWSRMQDLHVEPGNEQIHNVCPHCGATAEIFNIELFKEVTMDVVPEYLTVATCTNCKGKTEYADLVQSYTVKGNTAICRHCGAEFYPEIPFSEIWLDVKHKPKFEGFYNVIVNTNAIMVMPYEFGDWGHDDWLKVVWWRPSTYQPFKESPNSLTPEPAEERENPCPQCDEGELIQEGYTRPNGQTDYICDSCGFSTSFP